MTVKVTYSGSVSLLCSQQFIIPYTSRPKKLSVKSVALFIDNLLVIFKLIERWRYLTAHYITCARINNISRMHIPIGCMTCLNKDDVYLCWLLCSKIYVWPFWIPQIALNILWSFQLYSISGILTKLYLTLINYVCYLIKVFYIINRLSTKLLK